MVPIPSIIYSTFKSTTTTTPNIISPINTKMSSIHQCDEMSYIYETTLQKFNNYQGREESLRKFVLLRNFYTSQFSPINNNQQLQQEEYYNEKLEWSEEDVRKEEEWLDTCIGDASLGEFDDDDYVMIEVGRGAIVREKEEKEPIINYKEEKIIPNDSSLEESKVISNINNNISYQEFHPYWKDNSIIPPPSIDHYRPFFDQKSSSNNVSSNGNSNVESNNNSNSNNKTSNNNNGSNNSSSNFKIRSFSIPKIFHKYKLGHAILDLLQSDNQQYFFDQSTNTTNNTSRSQDDLDMLFYSPPKDLLDHGMLSDIISMLEWYGGRKNDSI